jgi:methyl-accepting chemotaxis protein
MARKENAMLRKAKLGTKVMLGYCVLIAMAMALGAMAVYRMKGVEGDAIKLAREYVPETGLAGQLERRVYRTMYAMRGYHYTGDQKFLDQALAAMGQVKESFGKLDELSAASHSLTKLKETLGEARQAMSDYEKLAEETRRNLSERLKIQQEMTARGRSFLEHAEGFLDAQNQAMQQEMADGASPEKLKERQAKIVLANELIHLGNQARIANWRSQALREVQGMEEAIRTLFPAMEQKVQSMEPLVHKKENQDKLKAIQADATSYREAMQQVLTISKDLEQISAKRVSMGEKALEISRGLASAATEHTSRIALDAEHSLSASATTTMVGLGIMGVAGLLIAVFLTRSITVPIRRVIAGLTDGAEQVASASTQVSSASQSLAEGASQQAAAIEETSSSLEEITSMTRQNADNARQADGLMVEARQVIHGANTSMAQLTESMGDISRASEETSKIIKTIDEIAFQTNLLALNAAVEAARAGEAGAGFAVVADEVRNLAMRAAEAARITADLIEGTVKKVKDGSELMQQTNESFQQVALSGSKVAELVAEISAASSEQAQGIEQITRAVSEMDKVTQQNAAGAEESASASEEMNAQAESMKEMVGDLVTMVGVDGGRSREARVAESHTAARRPAEPAPALPLAAPARHTGPGRSYGAWMRSQGVTAPSRGSLPLDSDQLTDF